MDRRLEKDKATLLSLFEFWTTLVCLQYKVKSMQRAGEDRRLPLTLSPPGPTRGSERDLDMVSET